MNNDDREMTYFMLKNEYALDGEDYNLIPHSNDNKQIVIGIRDNEDLSVKEHIIASIFSYWNQTNFYDELKNANLNLKSLDSIKKDYPHFQNVAGLTDSLKECNIVMRAFHKEYKDLFSETDEYVYASLVRNLSSFRSSLLLVYHSSEFAMVATLRQAFEQIGYCSYIIHNGIDILLNNNKKPNQTVKELNKVIPGLNNLYGELSDKTHINYDQFDLYYDKLNGDIKERSLNNVNDFIHLFGKISEAQISMIDIFLKKFTTSNIWYRKKLREHWAYHNAVRTSLEEIIKGNSVAFSMNNVIDESLKLPPTLDKESIKPPPNAPPLKYAGQIF